MSWFIVKLLQRDPINQDSISTVAFPIFFKILQLSENISNMAINPKNKANDKLIFYFKMNNNMLATSYKP